MDTDIIYKERIKSETTYDGRYTQLQKHNWSLLILTLFLSPEILWRLTSLQVSILWCLVFKDVLCWTILFFSSKLTYGGLKFVKQNDFQLPKHFLNVNINSQWGSLLNRLICTYALLAKMRCSILTLLIC